jgi:rubrerythrin
LLTLFEKYDIPVPDDEWPTKAKAPSSILEACETGVSAEIENAAMYDKLLNAAAEYPDVQAVLKNLQRASQENHLPAFQRCVDRGGSAGGGQGMGKGMGRRRRQGRCSN